MKIYDFIVDLLTQYPVYRNNDKELIWRIWESQGIIENGKLSKDGFTKSAMIPESIRRARQLVQQNHPELAPSERVKSLRKGKQKQKGTFAYREKVVPCSHDYQLDLGKGILICKNCGFELK